MKYFILLLAVAVAAFAAGAREDVGDVTMVNSGPCGGIGDWDYPNAVLHDNGPFVTGPGQGSGGADISEMNSGQSTYGFGFQTTAGNILADWFEVPAGGWTVETITIFGYQTGSGTTPTINDIRIAVYDDVPATGTIVYGDMATNVLTSNAWTNCYRVNTGAASNTDRPIMANECDFPVDFTLAAGEYWMAFQAGGTASSGPWANPVTISGVPSEGIAQQYTSSGWAQCLMGGTGNGVTFPFIYEGPVSLERSTWAEIKSLF